MAVVNQVFSIPSTVVYYRDRTCRPKTHPQWPHDSKFLLPNPHSSILHTNEHEALFFRRTIFAHTLRIPKFSRKILRTVSRLILVPSAISLVVRWRFFSIKLRIRSTLAVFCVVFGLPSLASSSTELHPFRKRFIHFFTAVACRPLSPYTRRNCLPISLFFFPSTNDYSLFDFSSIIAKLKIVAHINRLLRGNDFTYKRMYL